MSHKDVVSDKSLTVDSVARSEHHRTIATLDSLVRNIDFSFDTLKINIERPVEYAEAPEIIRLTAVRGRVIDSRKLEHNQVEDYNRLDTVAYHQSAVESSAEHSATTRLYNPPDGTLISVFAILIAGIIIYVFYRKKWLFISHNFLAQLFVTCRIVRNFAVQTAMKKPGRGLSGGMQT